MKHNFLFEEKKWKVKGTYTDEDGKKTKVTGLTIIKHNFFNWIIEAELYIPLKGGKTLDLRNVYKVKKITQQDVETTWTSENKIIGKFFGRFFIAGNIIFSSYFSKNKEYVGYETLEYMGGGKYNGYGKLFYKDKMNSSWKIVME
jgi:hypothetical protein